MVVVRSCIVEKCAVSIKVFGGMEFEYGVFANYFDLRLVTD